MHSRRTSSDRLLNAATLACLLASVLFLALRWHTLPEILPSHFDLYGHINGHASKRILWLLAGVSLAQYLLLSVLARFPHVFNLAAAPGAPDRRRQEQLALQMLRWIRLEIVVLFGLLLVALVHGAQHEQPPALVSSILAASVLIPTVVLLATIALFLRRIVRGPAVSS